MGNIRIVNGDIFQSGADVIIHQVNCQGVMGSGVAKQIREKYPNVFQKYHELCSRYKAEHNEKELLGTAQIVKVGSDGTKYVANLFAQENFGYDGKCYTDYEALRRCLTYVSRQFRHSTIAIPYL
ncbi:MAG: macro domain-containing protein, partial [Ruminococcus sp.]|nr:macro domain-containing protein [Ruminococcus sp.]